jgi:hypothetical protein
VSGARQYLALRILKLEVVDAVGFGTSTKVGHKITVIATLNQPIKYTLFPSKAETVAFFGGQWN